jgi:ankyrin repeat protein
MADPHDIDKPVNDASPSSGEVPNPPDPGGGMAMQGGNHESGGEGLGSGHSVTERDVEDRPDEEIVPDDGGEGHGEPGGATTLPGVSLSAGLRRASSFSETGVRTIQKKWKRSPSLPVTKWEHFQLSPRYANDKRNGEKKFQMVEADHDGAWFKAIEARDHVSLWRILNGKEDDASRVALCLETGERGRTALHVAAMQGCFRLAKQLIDLICRAYDPSGVSRRPSEGLIEFTGAKDGRSGQTALAIANDILSRRNTSISQYIRYVGMEPQEKEKYGGMYEAYQGTEWDTALVHGDCYNLWMQLKFNPRLLLQTCSTNGLSVLDVAIMKNNEYSFITDTTYLVEDVVSAFAPGGDKISWPEESCFPSEFTWKQLAVRHYDEDPRFTGRFSLENLAKLGVRNAETRRIPGPVTSAVQLAEEFESSAEIKGLLSKVGKHVERSTVDGEEVKKLGDVEVCQFVEADHDGAWFKAIEARDCLSLMTQLQSVHAVGGDALCVPLCYKTGEGGRTALHVAAMQGCFRLAKQLIDLICEKCPWSKNLGFWYYDEYDVYGKEGIGMNPSTRDVYLSQGAYEYTRAKDGRSGLTAFEMANDIIGNTSISQYMLYVGMDPRKEKEKEKYGGMYEAYQGTEWHTALVQGECDTLKRLLRYNSRFLLQTCGTNGLSVLDVAIMKDDEELVKMVVRAFGPRRDKILWAPESYFPSELTWEQIAHRHYDEDSRFHKLSRSSNYAKLGLSFVKTKKSVRSVRSAQDLAEKFGSSTEIKRFLGEVGEHVQGTTDDGVDFDPCLLGSLSEEGVFKSGDTELLESLLPEYNLLGEVANIIQEWNSESTAGFLADVDYNFEDKSSLRFSILRFHYACKHYQLHNLYILGSGENSHKRIEEGLFAMCDSQGRTPFHTMVDHYNHKHPFKEVHSFIIF